MHRRSFIAAAGVAAVCLAGCSESPGDGTTTGGTPTEEGTATPGTATTTATPPETYDVDVSFDSLQPGVVTPDSPDSIGVTRDAGQFLYVSASVRGSDRPPRDAFRLVADGEYSPMAVPEQWEDRPWRAQSEPPYSGETDGWLLFALPERIDAADSRLRWPSGEWVPGESLVERLSTPTPPFEVSLDAPARIDSGEQPWLTVTVANRGEVTGGFVGALNRIGPRIAYAPVARVTLVVPPGEENQWTWEPIDLRTDVEPDSERDSMELKFSWHAGRADRTVEIIDEEPET